MLFRPNIADPGQVAALVASLRGAAPAEAPLLVSIDQEGGVVQRVRAPATVWPPMLAVGEAGDAARTTAVGRALGEELAALGVGWDFAPVLDVHTNPANPVIGNRAFGTVARGGFDAGAGVLAGAARRGAGRLWQALPRSRRHAHRFAPRAAGRAARSRAAAPGGAGAVRRRRRRRDGGVHDGARSLSGARSRSTGDAVAPDRDRAACAGSSGSGASWSPTISG